MLSLKGNNNHNDEMALAVLHAHKVHDSPCRSEPAGPIIFVAPLQKTNGGEQENDKDEIMRDPAAKMH